jgi:hypothetical protein
MEFKKSIERLLLDLKHAGFDRRQIEADMGYQENYIDQVVSKGGNKRFLAALEKYCKNILEKDILPNTQVITRDAGQLTQQVMEDLLYLKASDRVMGMWISELAALLKKTSVASQAALLEDNVRQEVNRLYRKESKKR